MVSMEKPSKLLIYQCCGLGPGQPSNLAPDLKKKKKSTASLPARSL